MNYQKIYNQLIEKRRRFPLTKNKKDTNYIYCEAHHIVPKCLNGTDDPNNIINLTAREHFIAHYLLWKIYPCDGTLLAFYMFKKGNPHSCVKRDFKNSRLYETARLAYHEWNVRCHTGKTAWNKGMSGQYTQKKRTAEQRKRISEGRKKSDKCKGHAPWNKGKTGLQTWTEQQRQTIIQKLKGKKRSKEAKQKYSQSRIGLHWWNNGKIAIQRRECPGPEWKRGNLKQSQKIN